MAKEAFRTWQCICDKFERLLGGDEARGGDQNATLCKEIAAQQQLFKEIEFEWLRQWYIQGRLHADLHPYWHKPIKRLEEYVQAMEKNDVILIGFFETIIFDDNNNGQDHYRLRTSLRCYDQGLRGTNAIKTLMEHPPRRSHLQLVTDRRTTNVMSCMGSRRQISLVFVASRFDYSFEMTMAMDSSICCGETK